jgi:hypothetical protein
VTSTPEHVAAKLESLWADPEERARVRALLETYGLESYEREQDRVRLAILKLSEGQSARVPELVAYAKRDYRDVLMWAEYPVEGQTLWSWRKDLSDEQRRRLEEIRQQDRRQYEAWRKK